ncbi:hypothetical protein PHMEG_00016798 [Phytophthora megakarya]|uniref:Uncharacterized protein n=1 Tax=Phytophthora megakarya TaxID=4795 RepID=A0A225VXU7_9STRA|nr:hypothetical protein PHMEG_00016798 [Phytophthora megakarya]
MGGDVADCLPFLRPRVAPASLAAEVGSIAGQRELAALLGQFLAERMINSFIRRLLAKIRHLQATSEAERSSTLSSETLVARENFDTMRRECTVMCRHWSQRVQSLERARTDSENFLRQGHRDAESRHQARITELTDQVAQFQAQLRDSEAARQAAERRAEERVLDVNALVDFLMGNKPKINVMFNWVRLSALLHHFAEGTPISEGWLTNINVVALDDPRCEYPEYVKPSPRPGNGDSSSGSSRPKRPSVLDLSPPARNKRAAEGTLRLRHAKREPTPPWRPLGQCYIKVQRRKQSTRETEAIQAKLSESSDDEVQDPSYELSQEELDEAARAEAAADNDESSEDSKVQACGYASESWQFPRVQDWEDERQG